MQSNYPQVEDSASICALDRSQREELIADLFARLLDCPPAAAIARGIYTIHKRCEDILLGSVDALDVLMEEGLLIDIYNSMELTSLKDFCSAMSHHKPDMRVLEIGAGTGGFTHSVLSNIRNVHGAYMFGSYTYTDISAGFFVAAKRRFASIEGIDYRVLDISQDPLEQGFEAESFDLILATNVLHATPSLRETLSNVCKVLHSDGRLFFRELDPTTKWINFIMGTLEGWWHGDVDGRSMEPYVDADRWRKELTSVGLSSIEATVHDGHLCNSVVARWPPKKTTNRLTILRRDQPDALTESLARSLESSYDLNFCTLDQTPPSGQKIVSVLDLQAPFFHDLDQAHFEKFQVLLKYVEEVGMLWITTSIHIQSRDPSYGLVLGTARALRSEMGLDFTTLELESFDENGWKAARAVLAETAQRGRHNYEYVVSNGSIKVGRFQWYPLSERLLLGDDPACTKRLEIVKPGSLQTLAYKQHIPPQLRPDELKVETRAVGMNFKVRI